MSNLFSVMRISLFYSHYGGSYEKMASGLL